MTARLGFISYDRSAREAIPPARLHALLAEAALQGVGVVLLDGSRCDPGRGLVAGETWTPDGWIRDWVTLPDVVVIQEWAKTPEQSRCAEWVERARPVIADTGPDKLALYELLSRSPLARHAILSAELRSEGLADSLTAFLHAHQDAVIKPADGHRGSGVRFLHRDGDGWIGWHDRDRIRGTLDEVVAHAAGRIAGRLRYRRFLIQKYVRTVAPDGRPVDIRVHVQRRADREWGITRAYARLAEVGYRVSNISRGGYQGSLEGFLKGRSRRPAQAIQDEILALALDVARLVDAAAPRPLAELGVDLAIDDRDELWIIEANVRPQTSLHEHARAVHMIGYAAALAGRAATAPVAAAAPVSAGERVR